ncbi:hypothetical protein GCK72_013270 [Caenorhabditis remanei]|uniref:Uncharacterized protein n=1 Tax=Caenorhabditis remanei TaxID=31234 RepID=A0A6A5GQK5_CAERE|nr:hypothetical protein GCK72_013270 [Caenorhabditis remanei]KAF1756816.1 hypothetical protein GCK72_013270 [Caenorhabditis remanei]
MTSQPNLSTKSTSRPTILYDLSRVRETHIQITAKEASALRRTQLLRGTHTLSPPPSGTFPKSSLKGHSTDGRLLSSSPKPPTRRPDTQHLVNDTNNYQHEHFAPYLRVALPCRIRSEHSLAMVLLTCQLFASCGLGVLGPRPRTKYSKPHYNRQQNKTIRPHIATDTHRIRVFLSGLKTDRKPSPPRSPALFVSFTPPAPAEKKKLRRRQHRTSGSSSTHVDPCCFTRLQKFLRRKEENKGAMEEYKRFRRWTQLTATPIGRINNFKKYQLE